MAKPSPLPPTWAWPPDWHLIAAVTCLSAIAEERSFELMRSEKQSPGCSMSHQCRHTISLSVRTNLFTSPAPSSPVLIRSLVLTPKGRPAGFITVWADHREWPSLAMEVFTWPHHCEAAAES